MREKIYIWGAGERADIILKKAHYQLSNVISNEVYEIVGVIDNDTKKWGSTFHGLKIVAPGSVLFNDFDKIIIIAKDAKEIENQAVYGYRIPKYKLEDKLYLLGLFFRAKYINSQDKEVKDTVDYLSKNKLTMYNQFLPPSEKLHEVIWDKRNNMPYIEFEDVLNKKRKMYFPRSFQFDVKDEKYVLSDVLWEQKYMSPHLYTHSGHYIEDGDVIVDGGVCEGNFSLNYIGIASKIYMFEPDPWWEEANYYTFNQYENKISFVKKSLSNISGYNTATLDEIINVGDRVDFIKLDIEGAEMLALSGACRVLSENEVKVSACCYHKRDDAKNIKKILEQMEYKTSFSKGLITFFWDDDIWYSLDFRKGIVYGDKK